MGLALGACSPLVSGELGIDRVVPSEGLNDVDVAISIEGASFSIPVTSNVDDGTTRVGSSTVLLGSMPLDVVWQDAQTATSSVPAGTPIGTYPLTITIDDQTATLDNAYTVKSTRVTPPPGACGTPGAIADDFADGVAGTQWEVAAPANIVEANGLVAMTPTGNATVHYRSRSTVSLIGSAAELEVRTMVTGVGTVAFMQALNGTNTAGLFVVDGMLHSNVGTKTAMTVFDPVAHHHWRISEAAGILAVQVSPDGTTWTDLVSGATPAWAAYATIMFGANNPQGSTAPGTVTYASFSTFVGAATWCPATMLSDDFADGVIGLAWGTHGHSSNNACSETEGGGLANVDQTGTAACDAYYGASSLYSLTGSEVVAQIDAITTYTTGWITYIELLDFKARSVRLYFENKMMCSDGTTVQKACVAYNQVENLWRIREAGGTLYFESSVLGNGTWRTLRSLAVPFPLDAVRPRFGTSTDRAINQSIGLAVSQFN
jgi:hypothetical protein